MSACDDCLTRRWLLERLSPHLNQARARIDALLRLDNAQLIDTVGGRRVATLRRELAAITPAALQTMRRVDAGLGLETTCQHTPVYPEQLMELEAPPAVVSINGGAERLRLACAGEVVAIVGTRRASGYGTDAAREMAKGLAAAGVTVISGMAYGIDSAAHDGVLAVGGRTIAVLAGSADTASPSGRSQLFRQILEAGVVLSERAPSAKALPWALQARNRIIAGLANLTVLIEGPERSGALITVRHARTLKRTIGVLPGAVGVPQSAGPNLLLAKGLAGARGQEPSPVSAVRDAQDVLDLLYGDGSITLSREDLRPPLTAPESALLAKIQGGSASVALLEVSEIGTLSSLELKGWVRQGAGGVLTLAA